MLRDGKFIKEPPIKIGAHYVPPRYKPVSEEEQIMQHVILSEKAPKKPMSFLEVGLFMAAIYCATWMIVVLCQFLVEHYIG